MGSVMMARVVLVLLLQWGSLALAFSPSLPSSFVANHRGGTRALQQHGKGGVGCPYVARRRHGKNLPRFSMLTAAEANAALRQSQDDALQSLLQGGLGLVSSEGFEENGITVSTWTGDDVAWCSAVRSDVLNTLTSWNGPLKAEVPHLCMRVAASDAGL
jgi:hypothetical protein